MDESRQKLEPMFYAKNTVQAALQAIPYVGGTLVQFAYGPCQERRLRRIEHTLTEVALAIGPEASAQLINEQFINLLESVLPALSRATEEAKRTGFRDLLKNAGKLSQEDARWSEATLASQILMELDAPALSILAAMASCTDAAAIGVTIASRPVPQIFEGHFDYDTTKEIQHSLPYQWVVVEHWCRLLQEHNLIEFGSMDARGGFGAARLKPLGAFLISWIVSENTAPTAD